MRKHSKYALLLLCGASVLLTGAPRAQAQGLEEILVTARKRQESILQVPVIQTVITQESLEKSAITDLQGMSKRVTGVLLGDAAHTTGTQLSIRGVGTTALNQTIDQSTSLNIDGLSLTQGLSYGAAMYDIGQIEVLKGPQGLFYGKNSPAGVISVRSADPTDKFDIMLRGSYEIEGQEKVGEGYVSGPVADHLKLRLAGRYSSMEGYLKNVVNVVPGFGARNPDSSDFPKKDEWVVRGTALLDSGDNYTARLKYTTAGLRENGTNTVLDLTYCPDGTGPGAPGGFAWIGGNDCKLDNKLQAPWGTPQAFPLAPNNAIPFTKTNQNFGSLEQNLKLGSDLTLTSVTTYYNIKQKMFHMASSTGQYIAIMADYNLSNHQISQEVRLTSDFSSPLNFMVGGYYQSNKTMNRVITYTNRMTLPALNPILIGAQHFVYSDAYSIFGQGIYNITPELELAAGGRWTHEKRTHTQYNLGPAQGPTSFTTPTTLIDPLIKSNNFAPEVSLTYKPTQDLTVFASFKKGFKSGSFNSSTFLGPTTKASFSDEKVQGGELGTKSRWFDRSLQVNLAGYYYKYKDLQVGALELTQLPAGGGQTFSVRTLNAASAKVRGIDFDFTYAPPSAQGLTIYGAVNYNKATYDKFPNAPCGNGQTIAQGCNQLLNTVTGRFTAQNLSGRRLVKAPQWMGNLGFDYDLPVGNDMTVALGANTTFSSKYATALIDTTGFEQKGWAMWGANISLKGPKDKWEAAVIGKNLGNKYISGWCINSNVQNGTVLGGQISGAATQGTAGGDESVCSIQRGREVWFRVTVRPLAWMD
jgi:iron complex outermembrane receptor protein